MKSKLPHELAAVPAPPRRPVERDYLAALADLVPLDAWREICRKTVEAAKEGDPKARDWLARYLIGPEPTKLLALAADETAGFSTADLIDRERASREMTRFLSRPL
jgi:hypothetical protein